MFICSIFQLHPGYRASLGIEMILDVMLDSRVYRYRPTLDRALVYPYQALEQKYTKERSSSLVKFKETRRKAGEPSKIAFPSRERLAPSFPY